MAYEARVLRAPLFHRATPHTPVLDETPSPTIRANPVQNRPNPNKPEQDRPSKPDQHLPKPTKPNHFNHTISRKTLEIVYFPPPEKKQP
ncbi:MAG: hypothetical protein OXT70_04045 [Chloroflexota bacterium]|nr:hypothetical protein [Chloroflexota bacterium]